MTGKQPKRGDVVMEPLGMAPHPARHRPNATRSAYPPEIFDLITDILADLVLEDLQQFPQILTRPRIDRFDEQENTVRLKQNEDVSELYETLCPW